MMADHNSNNDMLYYPYLRMIDDAPGNDDRNYSPKRKCVITAEEEDLEF